MTISSQPRIQKRAPDFKAQAVVKGEFKEVCLDDFKGKYLVLFFYPADFTFVCPTEIIAFSDRAADFRKLNCEIVGCSTDSKFSHFNFINTPRKTGGLGSMDIPLLADITKKISRDYGVLIEDGDDEGMAARGTFIIDPKQNLRVAMINDLPIGRSTDEVMRLVEALQFNEKHGEVCPSNWVKGGLTMKDNIKDSKVYFAKVNGEKRPNSIDAEMAEKKVKLNK